MDNPRHPRPVLKVFQPAPNQRFVPNGCDKGPVRAVLDDYDLVALPRLRLDAVERLTQQCGTMLRRNDDTDDWRRRSHGFLPASGGFTRRVNVHGGGANQWSDAGHAGDSFYFETTPPAAGWNTRKRSIDQDGTSFASAVWVIRTIRAVTGAKTIVVVRAPPWPWATSVQVLPSAETSTR